MAQAISKETKATIENPDLASTNFYWTLEIEGEIFNLQTTARATQTIEQADAHIMMVMNYIRAVLAVGGRAKQVGKGATIAASEDSKTQIGELTTYPAEAASRGAEGLFDVEWIEAELKTKDGEGKWYFKVGGGNYSRFGVRVWDEELQEAGIEPEKVIEAARKTDDPHMEVQRSYRAYFTKNSKGNPAKVIMLQQL